MRLHASEAPPRTCLRGLSECAQDGEELVRVSAGLAGQARGDGAKGGGMTSCGCGEQMIGVEVRCVYDGVLFFECPSCGERAHRFPEGDWRRAKAERL